MTKAPEAAVIDASVAIKWVVEEEWSESALALSTSRLVAPDLLLAECANILWKKAGRGELSAYEAATAAAVLDAAQIELMSSRGHLERIVELAATLGHPAYDCCYLAIAEATGLPLVTADTKLVVLLRRSPARGTTADILTLAEIA